MKIAMLWHADENAPEDYWNCPLGLSFSFKKLGHLVDVYKFDAGNCNIEKIFPVADKYDFILISWPWVSKTLDAQIKKLREITKTKIILELGDEPQTFGQAFDRIKYVDVSYTQDLRCQKKYIEAGYNVHWLTHWGDEYLFNYDDKISRENRCITTCGKRYGTGYLEAMLGNKFINKRIKPEENHAFFNSGTIAYQFANNDEITRRIMEAGGCKLAVVTNRISQETGIYDLFKDGVDILYYQTQEDALNKINLLLEDDFLRNALAENIYKKINLYHRAETRCKQIIDIATK
jgi:hypothetical protein